MIYFLLLLLPFDLTTTEYYDAVEVNHFYDDKCRHVFDQLLFYRWIDNQHVIIEWRLIKDKSMYPIRKKLLWWDGERLRRIIYGSYRETWTQYDPELIDRDTNPFRRK